MSSNDEGGSKLGRNPRPPGDYEVGYGRPPRAHRFKKGEPSRNPKGRPRGTNRPAPDLVAALWQSVTIRMQGKERKVPYPEAMIQVAKDEGSRGCLRWKFMRRFIGLYSSRGRAGARRRGTLGRAGTRFPRCAAIRRRLGMCDP